MTSQLLHATFYLLYIFKMLVAILGEMLIYNVTKMVEI